MSWTSRVALILVFASALACMRGGGGEGPRGDAFRLPRGELPSFPVGVPAAIENRVAHLVMSEEGDLSLAWAGLDLDWTLLPIGAGYDLVSTRTDLIAGPEGQLVFAAHRGAEVVFGEVAPDGTVAQESIGADHADAITDMWLDALPDGHRLVSYAHAEGVSILLRRPGGVWEHDRAWVALEGGSGSTGTVAALLPDGRPIVGTLGRSSEGASAAFRFRPHEGAWLELHQSQIRVGEFALDRQTSGTCIGVACADAYRDRDGVVWLSPSTETMFAVHGAGALRRQAVYAPVRIPGDGGRREGTGAGRMREGPCEFDFGNAAAHCPIERWPFIDVTPLIAGRIDNRGNHGTYAAYTLLARNNVLHGDGSDGTVPERYDFPEDRYAALVSTDPPSGSDIGDRRSIVMTMDRAVTEPQLTCWDSSVMFERDQRILYARAETECDRMWEGQCLRATWTFDCEGPCAAPGERVACWMEGQSAPRTEPLSWPMRQVPLDFAMPEIAFERAPEPFDPEPVTLTLECAEDACGCLPDAPVGLRLSGDGGYPLALSPADFEPALRLEDAEGGAIATSVVYTDALPDWGPSWAPVGGLDGWSIVWEGTLPEGDYTFHTNPMLREAFRLASLARPPETLHFGPGAMQVEEVRLTGTREHAIEGRADLHALYLSTLTASPEVHPDAALEIDVDYDLVDPSSSSVIVVGAPTGTFVPVVPERVGARTVRYAPREPWPPGDYETQIGLRGTATASGGCERLLDGFLRIRFRVVAP